MKMDLILPINYKRTIHPGGANSDDATVPRDGQILRRHLLYARLGVVVIGRHSRCVSGGRLSLATATATHNAWIRAGARERIQAHPRPHYVWQPLQNVDAGWPLHRRCGADSW